MDVRTIVVAAALASVALALVVVRAVVSSRAKARERRSIERSLALVRGPAAPDSARPIPESADAGTPSAIAQPVADTPGPEADVPPAASAAGGRDRSPLTIGDLIERHPERPAADGSAQPGRSIDDLLASLSSGEPAPPLVEPTADAAPLAPEPALREPDAVVLAPSAPEPAVAEPAALVHAYTMIAPVELGFRDGGRRVGVQPGSVTFLKYERLAAALLADLARTKRI